MLTLRTNNPAILRLWSNAFPSVAFETISFHWNSTRIRYEAMSKNRNLVGHLDIKPSAFSSYESKEAGDICLFSAHVSSALDFALIGRHENAPVEATLQFDNARVRVRVSVEGWGSLTRILRHVPDALLAPKTDLDFGKAANCTPQSVELLREVHDAMGTTETLKVSFRKDGISFSHPNSKDDRFEPASVTSNSQAATLLDRAAVDYASRIVLHEKPTSLELSLIDDGQARVRYIYPQATLECFIGAVIQEE